MVLRRPSARSRSGPERWPSTNQRWEQSRTPARRGRSGKRRPWRRSTRGERMTHPRHRSRQVRHRRRARRRRRPPRDARHAVDPRVGTAGAPRTPPYLRGLLARTHARIAFCEFVGFDQPTRRLWRVASTAPRPASIAFAGLQPGSADDARTSPRSPRSGTLRRSRTSSGTRWPRSGLRERNCRMEGRNDLRCQKAKHGTPLQCGTVLRHPAALVQAAKGKVAAQRRVNRNWWHGLLLSDPRGAFCIHAARRAKFHCSAWRMRRARRAVPRWF